MLHVTSLKGKVNVKQIKEALHTMSTGGDALLKAYEKSMEMIQSQEKETRNLAMATLSWVAFSQVTLTLGELQHALAIEIGDDALSLDNITEPEIILSTCAGLLTLQQTTQLEVSVTTVHLVHETTQAYLSRTKDRWFPALDVRLAQSCLTYLSYSDFASGPCLTRKSFTERTTMFPLYGYVARHLRYYIGIHHLECRSFLEKLCLSDTHVRSCLQSYFDAGGMQDDPETEMPCFEHSNALFLAMKHQIYNFIPFLVAHGLLQQYAIPGLKEWSDEADREFSLVHYAVRGNFPECIQFVVSTPGVNCNALDANGRTALSYACESGYLQKVQLLLGMDLGVVWSPGLEYYHDNRVETGPPVSKANINYRDGFGRTALTYALDVRDDFGRMIKSLLSIGGIDCTSPDDVGRCPIHWAAASGVPENVEVLLMQPGVALQLRTQDSYGRTPLSYAIDRHEIVVTRALLTLIEAQTITHELVVETFRMIVSHGDLQYDHARLERELLRRLSEENSPFVDVYGSTMVHIAARSDDSLLQVLLSIPGITVNLVGLNGRTALWHCFDRKSKESCELLLSRDDINVNLCSKHGNGPIHLAAEWGDVDLMSSLLGKPDVRFGHEDFFGTPLHYAVYEQHVAIVQQLLDHYRATECDISYPSTTQWPADPHSLKAEKYRQWLGNDMAKSPERSQRDKADLGKELLAIAAANDSPTCFKLLESYLGIWTSLPRVWKRKCLLAAAESGGEDTLRYILKVLHNEETSEMSTSGIIHLGRQSWNSVDVFELACRATSKELNSWDNDGQTAIHAATKRKDMRTVRICMAMGGDHMAKNMEGQVAEDCMEEINDIDKLGKMDHWVYNCMIQECLSEKHSAVKST
jgi:ankyrin repeat protein